MPVKKVKMLDASGNILLQDVHWCERFSCKFRGLMFRDSLNDGEGLLFVEKKPSRVDTSIHMLFMKFAIAVIWLDENLIVVDKAIARPWRLAYAPDVKAQYTLECEPDILNEVKIGDVIRFEEL